MDRNVEVPVLCGPWSSNDVILEILAPHQNDQKVLQDDAGPADYHCLSILFSYQDTRHIVVNKCFPGGFVMFLR